MDITVTRDTGQVLYRLLYDGNPARVVMTINGMLIPGSDDVVLRPGESLLIAVR